VTWLSQELRVTVACRDTTRVVFRRLEGVVAPLGVKRPMLPGTTAPRKSTKSEIEPGSEPQRDGVGDGDLQPPRDVSKPSATKIVEGVPPDTAGTPPLAGSLERTPAEPSRPSAAAVSPAQTEHGITDTRE
jgi:hypothetical protein